MKKSIMVWNKGKKICKVLCKILFKVLCEILVFIILCIIYRGIIRKQTFDSSDVIFTFVLAICYFIREIWKEKYEEIKRNESEKEGKG